MQSSFISGIRASLLGMVALVSLALLLIGSGQAEASSRMAFASPSPVVIGEKHTTGEMKSTEESCEAMCRQMKNCPCAANRDQKKKEV